ncbi:MAG: serine/threonine-protein kinase [Myxococcota bacterium]
MGQTPPLEISSARTLPATKVFSVPIDYFASIVEFTQTPPGAAIGRYVVLETLGKGGMGTVLRAYDPKLRREVALKRLRSMAPDEYSEARLVREAQALAQLAHPNVVAVYDVDAEPEGVIVTMELVHGSTLRHWLETPRSWQACIDVMLQAGRGLMAAHQANLIHRDFKPANVMITPEGVAKVMDFGLAKPAVTVEHSEANAAESLSTSWRSSGHGLDSSPELETADHVVLGTPAYMAPEQHDGSAAGPAIDQYAFCVTLWEALHGRRPFEGTLTELVVAKLKGPPAWPRSVNVPRRLIHAVQRGLQVHPADRWPTMQDLLDELQAVARPRRSRVSVLLGATLLTGAVGSASWLQWSTPPPCPDPRERLVGVWDEPSRAKVGEHIEALDTLDAAWTWTQVSQRIDEYAESWVEEHREACEATTIRGEQSTTVLDRRMACLYRARAEWDATLRRLGELDARTLPRALELVERLPRLERCADVDTLLAHAPPPDDPEQRAAIERAQERLAEATTLHRIARYDETFEILGQIESELGEYEHPPLRAEILVLEGLTHEAQGRFEAAEDLLRRATDLAIAHGTLEIAALATRQWSFILGRRLERRDEGELAAQVALSLARRAPDPQQFYEAMALAQIASMKVANTEWDEADTLFGDALERLERAGSTTELSLAIVLNDRATLRLRRGALEEARADHRRALEIRERRLGANHPYVGSSLVNLGNVSTKLGDPDQAERVYERALKIFLRSYGPNHSTTTIARANLAALAVDRGELDRAAEIFEQVVDARIQQLGPMHPAVAEAYNNLGAVQQMQGKLGAARQALTRALEIWTESLEPDDNRLHSTHHNLGVLENDLGHPEQAKWHFERALTVSADARPDQLGHTQFEMAKLLWEQPDARARALALVREAIATYQQAEGTVAELPDAEAWLRERSPPTGSTPPD